jgi:glucokinase
MPPTRVIGIDAGGTKLLGGVVDERLVVHHRVHRTWRGADRSETLDIICEAVEEVRAAAPDVAAVGFGIPALVESPSGVALWSTHLPLEGVRFRDVMSERIGLPVVVDNDANAALVAEARVGAARDVEHAVLVALGTGIGSALLLDGRVYRGARGLGAEIGHMVVDLHGPDCQGNCPGRGCLEVMASGSTIGREGRAAAAVAAPGSALGRRLASGQEITGGIVTELAHAGDSASVGVLRQIGRRLGYGLVGVVNVFNPELVVIGGGAIAAGELLLGPAREVVEERALPPMREMVSIVPTQFADESGMLGAALLALDAVSPS